MNNIREYKEGDNIVTFNSKNENRVLSNMYNYSLIYNGIKYNSSEHLYQILKFIGNENITKIIQCCKTPFAAKLEANKYKMYVDKDFENKKNRIMLEVLQTKFNQCKAFRETLNSTKDKALVEYCYWLNSPYMAYWGTVYDNGVYKGINATGRLMMKVRENNLN